MLHHRITADRSADRLAGFDAAHATQQQRLALGRAGFDDSYVDTGRPSPFAPGSRDDFAAAYAAISRPFGGAR